MSATDLFSLQDDRSQDTQNWLNTSVQAFFAGCNWDDRAIPIAAVCPTGDAIAPPVDFTALTLDLQVRHYFAGMNWDGGAPAMMGQPQPAQPSVNVEDGTFTLSSFSDLF